MEIKILRDNKVVAKYNPKTRAITTSDDRLKKYVEEGVTLIGSARSREGTTADGPAVYRPSDDGFFPALVDRLWRDGYEIDDAGVKELRRQA